MRYRSLREEALAANQEIVRAGLVTLTFGNASAIDRDEAVMAIKASGVPYDGMDAEAIVVVDLESGETVEGSFRPSSDTPTHLVLYRRFEQVGGVVHTHSPFATAWAQAGRPIPCFGTTHADHFFGQVPVTRPLTSDEIRGDYEAETGNVIVETIESLGHDPLAMPAILVSSHGPFAWGAEAAKAVESAIALETVAAMALRTTLLEPGVEQVGDELLQRHFFRKHGPAAYYGQQG